MDDKTQTPTPPTHHYFLVKLTDETATGLEDLRYQQQRRLRRFVTKRELVERAIQMLMVELGREG